MLKISILDGYVDEPTCLGVPPYISPYPRYIAGAIWSFDKSSHISYVTIDQIRKDKQFLQALSKSDLIVIIAGMSVPGRYLSGFPASPNELVSPFAIKLKASFTKSISFIFLPPDIPKPYFAAGPVRIFIGLDNWFISDRSSFGLAGNPERYLPGTDIPAITTIKSD